MSRTEQRAGRGADRGLRRQRADGPSRVTNVELFFDLVYVFAVTQLSHYLLAHPTVTGALRTGAAAGDGVAGVGLHGLGHQLAGPEQIPVRLLLLGLMLVSLVMSAALPEAFTDGGVLVGGAYAVMQIGRSVFAVWSRCAGSAAAPQLRAHPVLVLRQRRAGGGGRAGPGRRPGRAVAGRGGASTCSAARSGFYTPGLGRSTTQEWDIEGGHFAERCQAFILIALGESIVVTGRHARPAARAAASPARRGRRRSWSRSSAARPVVAVLRPQRRGRGPGHRRTRPIPAGSAGRPTTSSTRSWWPGSSWSAAADEVVLSDPRCQGHGRGGLAAPGRLRALPGRRTRRSRPWSGGWSPGRGSRPWRCWPCSGCWRRTWPC